MVGHAADDLSLPPALPQTATYQRPNTSSNSRQPGFYKSPGFDEPLSLSSDHAAWKAQTQTQLSSARALRRQAQSWLRKDWENDVATSVPSTSLNIGVSVAAEDRMKKRLIISQGIASEVVDRLETLYSAIQHVSLAIADLQRASGWKYALQGVVEKRLELRSKRPTSENVRDDVQEMLEVELQSLVGARDDFGARIVEGQDLAKTLKDTSDMLNRKRHVLHMDSTGHPQEFLHNVRSLESMASRYAQETEGIWKVSSDEADKARLQTNRSLKKRIEETLEARKHIEDEIWQTQATILDTERQVQKFQTILIHCDKMDEEDDGYGEAGMSCEKSLENSTWTGINPALLSCLRSRIKAAAYTSTAGRELSSIFSRFDRDGSGRLGEDEMRKALRRTLRIPHKLVSDAEISVLCNALDVDRSGTISIKEIVRFLQAETDIKAIRHQVAPAISLLEQLRETKKQLEEDHRRKTLAWRIDDACIKVTPIKGLELDSWSPGSSTARSQRSRGDGGSVASPPGTARGRRRPLQPEALERIRTKILTAMRSEGVALSQKLDVLLDRSDKDGSGQLEEQELRKVIRRTLRMPESAISDSDISALITALSKDQADTVNIRDFVAFTGLAVNSAAKRNHNQNAVRDLEYINLASPGSGEAAAKPVAATTDDLSENLVEGKS